MMMSRFKLVKIKDVVCNCRLPYLTFPRGYYGVQYTEIDNNEYYMICDLDLTENEKPKRWFTVDHPRLGRIRIIEFLIEAVDGSEL